MRKAPRGTPTTVFFIAVVVLTVIVGFISYGLSEANRMTLLRGNQARFDLQNVLQLTLDQETGVRGFVAAKQSPLLQPYLDANREYPLVMSQLIGDVSTPDYDSVLPLVHRYDALHTQWVDTVVKPLLSTENRGRRDALQLRGKNLVDRMRVEEKLADDRIRSSLNDVRTRNRNTVILSTAAIVILTIVLGAAALESERRQRAEERRLAMQLAERNEELERSNQLLQEFAYAASHDLQEPLRTVASFTQLLQKRYAGKLDSEADEFMEYAVDGATRMQALIDDILRYSRVTTHGRPLEPVVLRDVVDRALLNLRASVAERSANITIGELPDVYGDAAQLAQLFQNLISNAIKYNTNESPRVSITATDGAQVVVSVADDGIGIAPEYHERIFRIFQRLHTRAEFPGTGVGLALCRRIVERHGGRIWLESVEGHGTTFSFSLHSQEEEIE